MKSRLSSYENIRCICKRQLLSIIYFIHVSQYAKVRLSSKVTKKTDHDIFELYMN